MTAPKRVQMSRQRPWRADNPDAVIVARPSKWGNPWTVGTTVFIEHPRPAGLYVLEFRVTSALAFEMYRQAFALDADEIRSALAGRDLACWCKQGAPCHADVLLEIANAS